MLIRRKAADRAGFANICYLRTVIKYVINNYYMK